MTPSQAELLAVHALSWLAGNDDLLPVFMNATGCDAETLRQRAGDPDFLASVLDFLLMDDAWVIGFAEATGQPPQAVPAARAALPGGQLPNWT